MRYIAPTPFWITAYERATKKNPESSAEAGQQGPAGPALTLKNARDELRLQSYQQVRHILQDHQGSTLPSTFKQGVVFAEPGSLIYQRDKAPATRPADSPDQRQHGRPSRLECFTRPSSPLTSCTFPENMASVIKPRKPLVGRDRINKLSRETGFVACRLAWRRRLASLQTAGLKTQIKAAETVRDHQEVLQDYDDELQGIIKKYLKDFSMENSKQSLLPASTPGQPGNLLNRT
ncbi:unnamed protein product [Diplocarpon coronariae]|uniref:Uncharacterized protein n=1 Tax=Diplocarpon coronariae TaxID=2795749 RepID=A0A218Z4Q1_9HELO|nr:hypothetical protein B2J93_2711 [Marssonina coronariae]